MDSPNTLQGLLQFTASIAAEFYVGRAGEPVPTGDGRHRTYNVEDAVNEAAALVTFALSPELAGRSFERAASLYGATSLLETLQPRAHPGQQKLRQQQTRTLTLRSRNNGKYAQSMNGNKILIRSKANSRSRLGIPPLNRSFSCGFCLDGGSYTRNIHE